MIIAKPINTALIFMFTSLPRFVPRRIRRDFLMIILKPGRGKGLTDTGWFAEERLMEVSAGCKDRPRSAKDLAYLGPNQWVAVSTDRNPKTSCGNEGVSSGGYLCQRRNR
jgi:hypothetical protein